jgi:hypothetical protein
VVVVVAVVVVAGFAAAVAFVAFAGGLVLTAALRASAGA